MDKIKKIEAKSSEEEKEALICKDILEEFLSHVPLVDLVSASRVSRAWKRAVSSSLRHVSPPKPWLIVHSQSSRPPYSVTAQAYDPRSGAWFLIRRRESPMNFRHSDLILSSNSTVLFALSPTNLAFSSDALRLRWTHAPSPPKFARKNPIVVQVSRRVVVFGGACEFGPDPIPIEIYDTETGAWSSCDVIPEFLDDSFSVSTRGGEMFVVEKISGLVYAFDPNAMTWRGPYNLRRRTGAFCTIAEFCGDGDMVSLELIGNLEIVEAVILTKFKGEFLEDSEELGEIPIETLEMLKGESGDVSSLSIAAKGDFVFVLNPSDPRAVIQCEIVCGGCRWTCMPNRAVDDASWIMQRLVLGCADVFIEDLRSAIVTEGVAFVADDFHSHAFSNSC